MVMYQEHFGLTRAPFSMHPDPAFLYLSDQHSSAKAFLESSALVNDSFVVITGSIGAGKTTLVEGFLSELPEHSTVIARINQTRLSPTGFLRLLLNELGLKAFKSKKAQLLARLGNFLGTCEREGKSVVIVVDEAQNLSRNVLEEIRLLTGSQHATCLSVVLVGQPEFLDILESPNLRQLAQRCRLRSHLASLDEDETTGYIEHRLAIAGSEQSQLFTEEAIKEIFEKTDGVPRLINNLCDTALICAFADGLEQVDENVIDAALKELKWQPAGKVSAGADRDSEGRGFSTSRRVAKAELDDQLAEKSAAIVEQNKRIKQLETELEKARADARATNDELDIANSERSRLNDAAGTDREREQKLAASEQRLSELHEDIKSFLEAATKAPDNAPDLDAAALLENLAELESQLDETGDILKNVENAGSRGQQEAEEKNNEIADLREELQSSHSQLEALQLEIEKLKSSEESSQKFASQLNEARAETESLKSEIERQRQSAGESSEGLKTSEDRRRELEEELSAALEKSKALLAEKESLEKQLENVSSDLETVQKQVSEQADALQENKEEIDELKSSSGELSGELEETRAALTSAEERLTTLQAENESVGSEVERQEKRVESRDHSIRTLEAEVRRKNKFIDELHDKLQPLPELSSQVETFKAENAELRTDLESRIHRIAELEEALSLSQQRLDDARHEIDNSHEQHVDLHKEIAEHKSQVSELQKGTNQRDDLVKSLQIECQNRKQDLRRLRSELDESLDQARELRDSTKVGENRVQELETELQAALETIREMNESGHAATTEVQQISEELTERNRRIEDLQAELEKKEATLISLETTLKEKTETIKVLELDVEETNELKKALADSEDVAVHEQLVKQLRREIEARDKCIDDLESSLATSSESLAKLSAKMEQQDAKVSKLEEQLESSRMAAAELREEMGRADREFEETSVISEDSTDDTSKSLRLQTLGAGLLISTNGHPARRVPLRSERIIIGRTRDSDIKVDNEFASRHHAQIIYDNGRFFVEDLNSTNGIFVNSRRVKRRRLRNRDIISIGRDRLIFVLEQHTSH